MHGLLFSVHELANFNKLDLIVKSYQISAVCVTHFSQAVEPEFFPTWEFYISLHIF